MAQSSQLVSDIMSRHVLVVHINQSFSEAWRLFYEMGIHHLPVVDDRNHLLGILSTNDILKDMAFRLPLMQGVDENMLNDQFLVDGLMTPDPCHISPEATIQEAAQLFTQRHFSALPVVKEGELVGIVTSRDLIKFLAEEKAWEEDQSRNKAEISR